MAGQFYPDEFVYGWPQKHCGCSQIIESCSHCCGSYTACSSCTHCYGRAYIEVPCPHSRAPRREAVTMASRSSSPLSPSSRASAMAHYQHNQGVAQLLVRGVSFDGSFVDSGSSRRGSVSNGSRGDGGSSRREPDHGLPPSPSSSTASSSSSSSSSSPKRKSRFGRNKKGLGGDGLDGSGSKGSRGKYGG